MLLKGKGLIDVQHLTFTRFALVALIVLVLGGLGASSAPQPLVTVAGYPDSVRFQSQGDVQHLQVMIFNLAGQKLFDSGLVNGRILEWRMLEANGQPLASGVYLYQVSVKDHFGHLNERVGKLVLLREQAGTIATPPLSEPTLHTLSYAPKPLAIPVPIGRPATGPWDLQGNAGTLPPDNFLGTTDAQPIVFKTNGKEVMRIDSLGRVGVGTAPTFKLQVNGSDQRGLLVQGPGNGVGAGIQLGYSGGPNLWEILATGTGASEGAGLLKIRELAHGINVFTINGPHGGVNSGISVQGDGGFSGDVSANGVHAAGDLGGKQLTVKDALVTDDLEVQNGASMNVGATAHFFFHPVKSDAGFNGACNHAAPVEALGGGIAYVDCNQDVAEAFASAEPTEPGDLVVLFPQAAAEPTVRKAREPYEGLLVGVVSSNPGLVFDHGQTYLAGDNAHLITQAKTVVALVGRARVKVSLENGSIAPGDPLTSSSTPGVAMKATKAGKIIGYALAEAEQAGEVLVLLQPNYYIPPLVLE